MTTSFMERFDLKPLTSIRPVSWVKFGLYALLLTVLYYSALEVMTKQWREDAFNYCYLIPFVVLYLVWDKREDLASTPSSPSWKGLVPLVFGVSLFWLGELGGEYFTLYISFWLVLVGLCWLHLGWQKLKKIGFALIFIPTMFPLPDFIYNNVTLRLQLISSQLGVAMIQLYGLPAYREGNIIDLGFTKLQVVEACSGLHSLISLVVLCLLLVYFFKTHLWKRIVLFISAVPLAISANSMRITATAILFEAYGKKVAEGFFHGFSGFLIFIICIPVLLLEMWILSKLPPSSSTPTSSELPSDSSATGSKGDRGRAKRSTRGALQPVFVVALVLVTATIALSQSIDFRERTPVKKSFLHFPLHVGEWNGTRVRMEQKFIDELNLSDYAIVDYQDRLDRRINFYVAYYQSQRKGESIHSPESCLPGSGWIFKQAGAKSISTPGYNGGSMRINRAFMQKSGYKQLAYYWFPQRGRILTNLYQLKIFTFWDALTKQRTDGALVRLITPVHESEELQDAEARLQAFTRAIVLVLEEYLPGKSL